MGREIVGMLLVCFGVVVLFEGVRSFVGGVRAVQARRAREALSRGRR